MSELAAVTDIAILDMSAILRLVAGGAAILAVLVVSALTWLCCTELRRSPRPARPTHPK